MHEEFYGLKREEPSKEDITNAVEDTVEASAVQDSPKEGTPLKSSYEVAMERSEQMIGASESVESPSSEDVESTREMERPEFEKGTSSESAESIESVEPNENQAEGGQAEDIETTRRMENFGRGEEILSGFKNKFNGVVEKAKAVKAKVQGFFSRLFGLANDKVTEAVGAVANGADRITDKASEAYSRGQEKAADCKRRCVEGFNNVQARTIERINNARLGAEQKITLMKALNMMNQTRSAEDLNKSREAEHQQVDAYYDAQIARRKNAEECLDRIVQKMAQQN